MERLHLSLPSLGEWRGLLRDLDGSAELLAEPGHPAAATDLLGRVLAAIDGSPVATGELLAAWRDRALAALFRREFGDVIDSRADCTGCATPFAFGFALTPILDEQRAASAATGLTRDSDGYWTLAGGGRLRPPTMGDIASHADSDALLAALTDGAVAAEAADAALDAAAPVLSVDIAAACPHCDAPQTLNFEIGRYLVECLAAERPLLIRETHLIASRYGWPHDTIMALPRADRRAYAHLIVGERSVAALRRAG